MVGNTRLTLYLILASFMIPLSMAYWYFYVSPEAMHPKTAGTLYSRGAQIDALSLTHADATPLRTEELSGHWHVFVKLPTELTEPKLMGLYDQWKRFQLALGKFQNRIQIHWVSESKPLETQTAWPLGQWWMTNELSALGEYDRIIADPRGFLVLGYPTKVSNSAMNKELTKLLKQVG